MYKIKFFKLWHVTEDSLKTFENDINEFLTKNEFIDYKQTEIVIPSSTIITQLTIAIFYKEKENF